jgi:tRNA(Ile2) C34 agmatinyltransferase TiaS
MGVKICPTCGSEDITYVSGGLNGLWKCKGCGYENDIFPVRDEISKPEDKNDTK